MRNLLAMAATAVAVATVRRFVRNSRQSDKPDIRALFGSKAASLQSREQAYCAPSAAPSVTAICAAMTSNPRRKNP